MGSEMCIRDRAVPTHLHSRKQGDILFESVLANGQHVVADVTVCHPVLGSPQSPSGVVGSWQTQAMGARYNRKLLRHRDYYKARCLEFVPLVVSTFGVLHADFARLLWLLASPTRDPTLAVGGGASCFTKTSIFLQVALTHGSDGGTCCGTEAGWHGLRSRQAAFRDGTRSYGPCLCIRRLFGSAAHRSCYTGGRRGVGW